LSHAVVSPIAAVHLWGIDWTCSFGDDGRIREVLIGHKWLDARDALRGRLCDALERAHKEMPA
jgi:hypothetical protein